MPRWLVMLLVLILPLAVVADVPPIAKPKTIDKEHVLPKGVPAKVARVLKHVDETGEPLRDYVGGRHFGNFENRLPKRDKKGRNVKYQEWDVNPKVPGRNRGAERLVTGSDGSAFYSGDHYKTFIKIR